MLCAILYHLYNSKNVKNTHGGVLLIHHGCFSRFLNCTNGTKSCKDQKKFWKSFDTLRKSPLANTFPETAAIN